MSTGTAGGKRRAPISLFECIGCSHVYHEPVSACDCMENPENRYLELEATPKQVPVDPCKSCLGSDEPSDQVDCPVQPCQIGRPRTRDADPIRYRK